MKIREGRSREEEAGSDGKWHVSWALRVYSVWRDKSWSKRGGELSLRQVLRFEQRVGTTERVQDTETIICVRWGREDEVTLIRLPAQRERERWRRGTKRLIKKRTPNHAFTHLFSSFQDYRLQIVPLCSSKDLIWYIYQKLSITLFPLSTLYTYTPLNTTTSWKTITLDLGPIV